MIVGHYDNDIRRIVGKCRRRQEAQQRTQAEEYTKGSEPMALTPQIACAVLSGPVLALEVHTDAKLYTIQRVPGIRCCGRLLEIRVFVLITVDRGIDNADR